MFFVAIALIAHLSGYGPLLGVAVGGSIPAFFFLVHRILDNEARAKSDENVRIIGIELAKVRAQQAESTAAIAKLTSEQSENKAVVVDGVVKDKEAE